MGDEFSPVPDDAVALAGEEISWFRGTMRLRLDAYLTSTLRDSEYITSVRAVLLTPAGCAVLRNKDGLHVLPGGRRGAQETIQEALHREILEETGCRIVSAHPLGILCFRHLTPKPANYRYPYPVFLHALFVARGVPDPRFAGDPDRYEETVEFVAPKHIDRLGIPAYQRLLLKAAVSSLT